MSSTLDAVVNLCKMCVGAGILALPYATVEGGLLTSALLMLLVAILNGFSCCMLLRSKRVCSRYKMEVPAEISSTYAKLAYYAWGWTGVIIIDTSIIITLLGVCVTYVITFAQLMGQIIDVPFAYHILLFGVIVYPICCVKNISRLAAFSFLGIICLVGSSLVILFYGYFAFGFPTDHSVPPGKGCPLLPKSLGGLLGYVGVATFCIDIVTPIFPIEESLINKKNVYPALVVSLFSIWVIYVSFADVAALLFHDNNGSILKTNILLNLPLHGYVSMFVRAFMAAVCILTYPITLLLSAQMLEKVVLSKVPSWADAQEEYHVLFSPSSPPPSQSDMYASPKKGKPNLYGSSGEPSGDLFETAAVELQLEIEIPLRGDSEAKGTNGLSPLSISTPTGRRGRG